MDSTFNKAFANFLDERMGEAIAKLRDNNEKYRLLLQKRQVLSETSYQGITKEIFEEFIEVNQAISDLEGHYLLLTGMRLQKQIFDSVVAEDFNIEFIE